MTTAAAPTALDRLADAYWEAFLRRNPTFATALGDRRFDDRLEDNSSEANEAWRALLDGFQLELADIGDEGDSTTRAALADALRVDRAVLDADVAAFNVDPMNGPQVELLNIPSYQPIRSPAEADALLERWRAMPAYLDQAVADLRRGTAEGRHGSRDAVHEGRPAARRAARQAGCRVAAGRAGRAKRLRSATGCWRSSARRSGPPSSATAP